MTYSLTLIRADSFWWRLIGLLGHPPLQDNQGLCLMPCAAIHTFGLWTPIDVVFLSSDWRILKQYQRLPPWRVAGCFGAGIVIELPAGFCARHATHLPRLLWRALLESGICPKNL